MSNKIQEFLKQNGHENTKVFDRDRVEQLLVFYGDRIENETLLKISHARNANAGR